MPPENGGENDGWDGPRGISRDCLEFPIRCLEFRVGFLRWLSFFCCCFGWPFRLIFHRKGWFNQKKPPCQPSFLGDF